ENLAAKKALDAPLQPPDREGRAVALERVPLEDRSIGLVVRDEVRGAGNEAKAIIGLFVVRRSVIGADGARAAPGQRRPKYPVDARRRPIKQGSRLVEVD